jgi:hypothetical protein
MPKVHHVKAARKPIESSGIKKGDSYYWWKLRMGRSSVTRVSKTPPRPSELTMSSYKSSMYAAEESLQDAVARFRQDGGIEDLIAAVEDAQNTVDEQRDECENSLESMPDSLQQGSTGELLQSRIDACESISNDLEQLKSDLEEKNGEETEDKEEGDEDTSDDDRRDELAGMVDEIGWDIE